MHKIVCFFYLLLSINVFSDVSSNKEPLAEFSGQGMIKTKADFISLNLVVRSECEPSPKDAQKSTDKVTKEIDDFLATLKKDNDEHYKVLIDGGFSTPFSRWRRHHDRDYEICRNTFQKTTNILLRMGVRDDFHDVFDAIQDFVFKKFKQNPPKTGNEQDVLANKLQQQVSQGVKDQNSVASKKAEQDSSLSRREPDEAITYVSIGVPYPDIDRERRRLLEQEAIDLAVRDAKANFMASIRSCEPHRWKIHSIKDGSYDPSPPRFHRAAMALAEPSGGAVESAAPVRFDNLEILKNVTVNFQFEGNLCFESSDSHH